MSAPSSRHARTTLSRGFAFPSTVTILALAVALLAPASARAAKISASAALTSPVTRLGEPVQLQVQVTGTQSAQVPRTIAVDGLEISLVTQSMQVQMLNFQMTASVVYIYMVVPTQEGEFTIPSIRVRAEGKDYTTVPLPLRVEGSGSPPVRRAVPNTPGTATTQPPGTLGGATDPAAPDPVDEGKLAFAEMLVPKKTAFVGEVIPIEIRFYFSRRASIRLRDRVQFGGDGFTGGKLGEPSESVQQVEGNPYNVLRFQTSIVPVKAGKLELAPASVMVEAQTGPSNLPQGMNDLFAQFFGQSGGPQLGGVQELDVTSNPAEIDVRPLPSEGRPASFSGAVGEFTMVAEASPLKVGAGDPVTMKISVAGQGNFDAMGPPLLTGDEGWRLYPPKETFKSADAIGFGGKKVFESLMVAQRAQMATPGVEFSYFDPAAGKYVTLTSPPIPVEAVAGAPSPTPAAVVAAAPSPDATATPTPPAVAPTGSAGDSLFTSARWDARFHPAWQDVWVWGANIGGATLFVALLAIGLAQGIRHGRGSKVRAWSRENRLLRAALDDDAIEDQAFYERAAGLLQREAAGLDGVDSAARWSADDVLAARRVDVAVATEVRRIFDVHSQYRYGVPGGTGRSRSEERQTVRDAVDAYVAGREQP